MSCGSGITTQKAGSRVSILNHDTAVPSLTVLKQTSNALKNTLTVDITFIAMFLMIPFSVSQEKNKAYLVQEQQFYWG